mgnify:FL=1
MGFAAQSGDIIKPALGKLKRKGLDAIVANPVDQPESGFGSDLNHGAFLDKHDRHTQLAPNSKLSIAHQIYDLLLPMPTVNSQSVH